MATRSLSVGLGVAVRGSRKLAKDPTKLLSPVSTPLLSFIAFTGALSALGNTSGFGYYSYTAFEFVFVLYSAVMMVGVFTAIDITQDFEGGMGSRLMLAVPRRLAILLGYLMLGVVRTALAIGVLWGIAAAIGMNVRGHGLEILGFLLLALLLYLAAALYGAGVALRLRSQAAGGLILLPVYLALFLSPVLTPRDQLSGWLQAVARVNPLTSALEAGRGFLADDPTQVATAFGAAGGLVAFFFLWAVRGMKKAEQGPGGGRRPRRRRAG